MEEIFQEISARVDEYPPLQEIDGNTFQLYPTFLRIRDYYSRQSIDLLEKLGNPSVPELRATLCKKITSICQIPNSPKRGRKIVLHPLLAFSAESDSGDCSLSPSIYFPPSSSNLDSFSFNGISQWGMGLSFAGIKGNFATCPSPNCLIGSYNYSDHIIKHL